MTSNRHARQATPADVDALVALWQAGGVGLGPAVDRAEIQAKLNHDPDLFLVVESDDADRAIVASIMGTYDGHRGRIKRCVVDPARRGQGLGRGIVEALEARFVERGITELRLEVWADNSGALAFWEDLGWELLADIRYFQRSLR